jgi:type II secretory pathway component PulF
VNNQLKDFAYFERALSKLGGKSESNLIAVRDSVSGELESSAKLWYNWRMGQNLPDNLGFLSALNDWDEAGGVRLEKLLNQAGSAFDKSWEYLSSNLSYLAYALIVFILVSAIYAVYIWPSFNSLYSSLDQEIPEDVRSAQSTALVLILFSVVFTGAIVSFLSITQKRVSRLAQLPSSTRAIFFLNRFEGFYHFYLLVFECRLRGLDLNSTSLKARAGDKSINWEHLSREIKPYLIRLDSSSRLGFSEEEFEQFMPELLHEINAILFTARSRMILFAQISIFISIGAVIAAMYMPIFGVGVLI